MYVYIYIYIHIHIHTYTHTHIHTRVYTWDAEVAAVQDGLAHFMGCWEA